MNDMVHIVMQYKQIPSLLLSNQRRLFMSFNPNTSWVVLQKKFTHGEETLGNDKFRHFLHRESILGRFAFGLEIGCPFKMKFDMTWSHSIQNILWEAYIYNIIIPWFLISFWNGLLFCYYCWDDCKMSGLICLQVFACLNVASLISLELWDQTCVNEISFKTVVGVHIMGINKSAFTHLCF